MGDKPHKRLEAWKRALELVTDVYKLTRPFPAQERYALVDKMRRAAAGRLGYMSAEGRRFLQSSCEAVDRLLNGLVRSMRSPAQ